MNTLLTLFTQLRYGRHGHLSGEAVIVILVIALFICLIAWHFSRRQVVRRKLRKMPHKPIGEYQDGECGRLMGQVKAGKSSFRAPLSGRKCAYYYVLVEERRSSGRNSSWYELIEEENGGDVLIQDGKHFALVLTRNNKSWIDQDWDDQSGTFNDASETMKKYLGKHGHSDEGILGFNRTLRYKEGVIEENEILTVSGKVEWRKASALGYSVPGDRILVIGPETDDPVFMTDSSIT